MTDWKAMAGLLEPGIPVSELTRTVAPLAALETTFQNLAAKLTASDEPAVVFDPAPGDLSQ